MPTVYTCAVCATAVHFCWGCCLYSIHSSVEFACKPPVRSPYPTSTTTRADPVHASQCIPYTSPITSFVCCGATLRYLRYLRRLRRGCLQRQYHRPHHSRPRLIAFLFCNVVLSAAASINHSQLCISLTVCPQIADSPLGQLVNAFLTSSAAPANRQ